LAVSNHESAPLIITGVSRSGTSYLSALLQRAGLDIGRRLIGPNVSNLRGHFENLDFVELHQEILQALGLPDVGWVTQGKVEVTPHFREKAKEVVRNNASALPWGWKDPRTTLFLDFWAQLLPEAKFIFIFRPPWNVFDSLLRRGTDAEILNEPTLALDVWTYYNRTILDFHKANPHRSLITPVEYATGIPNSLIQNICDRFDLPLSEVSVIPFNGSLLKTDAQPKYWPLLIRNYFPEILSVWGELVDNSVYCGLTPIEGIFPAPDAMRKLIAAEAANVITERTQSEVEIAAGKLAIKKQHARLDELEKKYGLLKQTYRDLEHMYEKLRSHSQELAKACDAHERAYQTVERERIELEQVAAQLKERIVELEQSLESKARALDNITSSRSWKLRNSLVGLLRSNAVGSAGNSAV
jgi:hypothetical protein